MRTLHNIFSLYKVYNLIYDGLIELKVIQERQFGKHLQIKIKLIMVRSPSINFCCFVQSQYKTDWLSLEM